MSARRSGPCNITKHTPFLSRLLPLLTSRFHNPFTPTRSHTDILLATASNGDILTIQINVNAAGDIFTVGASTLSAPCDPNNPGDPSSNGGACVCAHMGACVTACASCHIICGCQPDCHCAAIISVESVEAKVVHVLLLSSRVDTPSYDTAAVAGICFCLLLTRAAATAVV